MSMKQKFGDFLQETVFPLWKKVEASEEVAASEAEVVEEPKSEAPSKVEQQVQDIHDALYGEVEEVETEEAPVAEAPKAEAKEEPKAEPKVDLVQMAKEQEEQKPAETVSKKDFDAMKAELDAFKKAQEEQAKKAAEVHHNPEAKSESTTKWGGISQSKTWKSPQERVFEALNK